MIQKTEQIKVYIAEDGTKFLDENECKEYEKKCADLAFNFKIFEFRYNPDLTERGCLQSKGYILVYSKHGCHYEIALRYIVDELKIPILDESVQGYQYQPHFNLFKPTSNDFSSSLHDVRNNAEKFKSFLLSPEEFTNFLVDTYKLPVDLITTFDYIKHWGFK